MGRMDELVSEYCPNGVDYQRLDECCILEKGATPIQKAIPGDYPLVVTTNERKSSDCYQFDAPTVCIPLVSSRGHGVACLNQLYYQKGKFALGNILCGVTPKDTQVLSAKFLYYYLNHKKDLLIVPLMKGGANVSLTVDSLRRIRVPIPPIQIQEEIIRILSCFDELESALSEELAARKIQYKYYRNKLLSSASFGIAKSSLGELCDVVVGGEVPNEAIKGAEADMNHPYPIWGNGKEVYGFSSTYTVKEDAVCISSIGANTGAVYYHEGKFTPIIRLKVLVPKSDKIFNRYLFHAVSAVEFAPKKSSVPNMSSADIKRAEIAVPPLDVQKRIAYALDNFEKICNDLNIGLPAEIAARNKQYEFYRNALLTFMETGGTILTDRT